LGLLRQYGLDQSYQDVIQSETRILDIFMAIPGSRILFFFGIGNQTTYRTCVRVEGMDVGEATFETQKKKKKVLILWVPPPGKVQ